MAVQIYTVSYVEYFANSLQIYLLEYFVQTKKEGLPFQKIGGEGGRHMMFLIKGVDTMENSMGYFLYSKAKTKGSILCTTKNNFQNKAY